MDMKLELVPIPVSDVKRAKAFHAGKVGFDVDMDFEVSDEARLVQLTPLDRPARSTSEPRGWAWSWARSPACSWWSPT